jgi:hypothetical protein
MSTQGALSLHHDGDVGRIKLIPSLRRVLVIGSFPRLFFAVDFVTTCHPLTRGGLGELPRQMVTDQILIVDVCDPVFPPATNLWSADSSGLSTPCAPLSQRNRGVGTGPQKDARPDPWALSLGVCIAGALRTRGDTHTLSAKTATPDDSRHIKPLGFRRIWDDFSSTAYISWHLTRQDFGFSPDHVEVITSS